VTASHQLSLCIPAYNRPRELERLLESIAQQYTPEWEVVICEDQSPKRGEIAAVVRGFSNRYPRICVRYFENYSNFGYDRNLRELLDRAEGEYCVFMGDDDVLTAGALAQFARGIEGQSVGFLLRAWKSVDAQSGHELEVHRYFPSDRKFAPGQDSIAALFRRAVFISGLVFHRDRARQHHTDRFDGTLLYQLYLVGHLVNSFPAAYISAVVVTRMIGAEHFFGSSGAERVNFSPRNLLPEHSVRFVQGLLRIARAIDEEVCSGVFDMILAELAVYSYPILEIQAERLSKWSFCGYAREIGRLGFHKSAFFWVYFLLLLIFGPRAVGSFLRRMKGLLGSTPVLRGSLGSRR